MSHLDSARNLLHARVVYWGPAGSGKTTTLAALKRFLDPEGKVRFYSITDGEGGTYSFDLLPLEEFRLGSYRVRARLLSAPGTLTRSGARVALLREADVVVFVADARSASLEANRQSARELEAALKSHGIDPVSMPVVWAINQQDHGDSHTGPELRSLLKARGPVFDTLASEGRGVMESFSEAFRLMTRSLAQRYAVVGADPDGVLPSQTLPQLVRGSRPRLRAGEETSLVVEVPPRGFTGPAQMIEAQLRLAEAHHEMATLNRHLEERNRELMAVNRVARSILSALEAENLLVVLLDATAEHLAATHASCVLFDPSEEGQLRTHVLGFGRDPVLGLPQPDAHRFFELVHSSDGPIPVDDKRNVDLRQALCRVDRRIRRVMYQPIKTNRGDPAGWIGIYATGEEPPLTTQGLLFLSSISRLAALGLDKIALLDKVQRFSARLEEEVHQRTGELELANAKIRALNRGLEARVTERTRALEEANRKLKEARAGAIHAARLSGMGQLAASFAAEVNNPVAGLTANLSFLRENLDDLRARVAAAGPAAVEALEAVREFEKVIEESDQSAQRISAILTSLKRFGGEARRDETVSLNAVLADAITLLEERMGNSAELDLKLGTLPDIRGVSLDLRHVVLALLTNALEAIERRGERGHIAVTTFQTGDKLTLTVKDDGRGIEGDLLPRIFEPFVTTKEGEPSAGLGLHCALKTVQSHGGTIRVRSRTGEGTTVTVELPTTPAPTFA